MRLLLACLLLTSASAQATDYLSIVAGGTDTEYVGALIHLDAQGLGGTIILNALWPGQTSSFEDDGPIETGAWHIIVRQDDGTSTEQTLQCAARISYASTCGTVRLSCIAPSTSAVTPKARGSH